MTDLIDVSHWQPRIDFAHLGVPAVIHKATDGTQGADDHYIGRKTLAKGHVLYGAYHFGRNADGVRQADHFLAVAAPDADTLVALDVERAPDGPSMTLAQAEAFALRVFGALKRWPVIYGGGDYLRDVLKPGPMSPLARCPLWFARYGPEPTHLPGAWQKWTLWQWTDAAVVSGVTGKCDGDRFAGTVDELRAWWAAPGDTRSSGPHVLAHP